MDPQARSLIDYVKYVMTAGKTGKFLNTSLRQLPLLKQKVTTALNVLSSPAEFVVIVPNNPLNPDLPLIVGFFPATYTTASTAILAQYFTNGAVTSRYPTPIIWNVASAGYLLAALDNNITLNSNPFLSSYYNSGYLGVQSTEFFTEEIFPGNNNLAGRITANQFITTPSPAQMTQSNLIQAGVGAAQFVNVPIDQKVVVLQKGVTESLYFSGQSVSSAGQTQSQNTVLSYTQSQFNNTEGNVLITYADLGLYWFLGNITANVTMSAAFTASGAGVFTFNLYADFINASTTTNSMAVVSVLISSQNLSVIASTSGAITLTFVGIAPNPSYSAVNDPSPFSFLGLRLVVPSGSFGVLPYITSAISINTVCTAGISSPERSNMAVIQVSGSAGLPFNGIQSSTWEVSPSSSSMALLAHQLEDPVDMDFGVVAESILSKAFGSSLGAVFQQREWERLLMMAEDDDKVLALICNSYVQKNILANMSCPPSRVPEHLAASRFGKALGRSLVKFGGGLARDMISHVSDAAMDRFMASSRPNYQVSESAGRANYQAAGRPTYSSTFMAGARTVRRPFCLTVTESGELQVEPDPSAGKFESVNYDIAQSQPDFTALRLAEPKAAPDLSWLEHHSPRSPVGEEEESSEISESSCVVVQANSSGVTTADQDYSDASISRAIHSSSRRGVDPSHYLNRETPFTRVANSDLAVTHPGLVERFVSHVKRGVPHVFNEEEQRLINYALGPHRVRHTISSTSRPVVLNPFDDDYVYPLPVEPTRTPMFSLDMSKLAPIRESVQQFVRTDDITRPSQSLPAAKIESLDRLFSYHGGVSPDWKTLPPPSLQAALMTMSTGHQPRFKEIGSASFPVVDSGADGMTKTHMNLFVSTQPYPSEHYMKFNLPPGMGFSEVQIDYKIQLTQIQSDEISHILTWVGKNGSHRIGALYITIMSGDAVAANSIVGDSFGLALAAALLGLPSGPLLTGCVGPDGEILAVGELPAKAAYASEIGITLLYPQRNLVEMENALQSDKAPTGENFTHLEWIVKSSLRAREHAENLVAVEDPVFFGVKTMRDLVSLYCNGSLANFRLKPAVVQVMDQKLEGKPKRGDKIAEAFSLLYGGTELEGGRYAYDAAMKAQRGDWTIWNQLDETIRTQNPLAYAEYCSNTAPLKAGIGKINRSVTQGTGSSVKGKTEEQTRAEAAAYKKVRDSVASMKDAVLKSAKSAEPKGFVLDDGKVLGPKDPRFPDILSKLGKFVPGNKNTIPLEGQMVKLHVANADGHVLVPVLGTLTATKGGPKKPKFSIDVAKLMSQAGGPASTESHNNVGEEGNFEEDDDLAANY